MFKRFSADLCSKCDTEATCKNGRCVCNEGFYGNGFTCKKSLPTPVTTAVKKPQSKISLQPSNKVKKPENVLHTMFPLTHVLRLCQYYNLVMLFHSQQGTIQLYGTLASIFMIPYDQNDFQVFEQLYMRFRLTLE